MVGWLVGWLVGWYYTYIGTYIVASRVDEKGSGNIRHSIILAGIGCPVVTNEYKQHQTCKS